MEDKIKKLQITNDLIIDREKSAVKKIINDSFEYLQETKQFSSRLKGFANIDDYIKSVSTFLRDDVKKIEKRIITEILNISIKDIKMKPKESVTTLYVLYVTNIPTSETNGITQLNNYALPASFVRVIEARGAAAHSNEEWDSNWSNHKTLNKSLDEAKGIFKKITDTLF